MHALDLKNVQSPRQRSFRVQDLNRSSFSSTLTELKVSSPKWVYPVPISSFARQDCCSTSQENRLKKNTIGQAQKHIISQGKCLQGDLRERPQRSRSEAIPSKHFSASEDFFSQISYHDSFNYALKTKKLRANSEWNHQKKDLQLNCLDYKDPLFEQSKYGEIKNLIGTIQKNLFNQPNQRGIYCKQLTMKLINKSDQPYNNNNSSQSTFGITVHQYLREHARSEKCFKRPHNIMYKSSYIEKPSQLSQNQQSNLSALKYTISPKNEHLLSDKQVSVQKRLNSLSFKSAKFSAKYSLPIHDDKKDITTAILSSSPKNSIIAASTQTSNTGSEYDQIVPTIEFDEAQPISRYSQNTLPTENYDICEYMKDHEIR